MAEMSEDAAAGLLFVSMIFGAGIGIITHNAGWGLVAFCVFPLAIMMLDRVMS